MIKVDEDSTTLLEPSSVPLDQTAARYDLQDVFEACKSLKTEPELRKKPQQQVFPATNQNTKTDLEWDFTPGNGTSSNLECPFAKVANGNPPNAAADPIAAEFHGDGSIISGTAYAQQNPNKCPIRYLDRHSPEEVAKYFQNHKHEVPRSHAVCISRYQQNDAKIRQLDAKYGNLQNMIQSLGVKHQQYLPAKDGEEDMQREASQPGAEVVEKWAENVSRKSHEPVAQPKVNGAEEEAYHEGTQHFEKPLREIRLGESPSRPWGISVPVAQETAASAIPSDRGIEPLSLDRLESDNAAHAEGQKKEGEAARRCPFDHVAKKGRLSNEESEGPGLTKDNAHIKKSFAHASMIFNGPVFFGYPPEQAIAMMQSGVFDSSKK